MAERIGSKVQRLEDWFDGLTVVADSEGEARRLEGLLAPFADRLPVSRAGAARPASRHLLMVLSERAKPPGGEAFVLRLSPSPRDHEDGVDLALDASTSAQALETAVCAAVRQAVARPKKLNILVLYCDAFTHIETINEHLKSFSLFSRHNVFFFPASDQPHWGMFDGFDAASWPDSWDLDRFDVIVWHYVMPAYLDERLAAPVAERLAAYDGLKVLFVQDEYDNTATTTRWMRRVGIDLMFTCVPPDGLDYVYQPCDLPGVEFFRTLTGYVPEDRGLERYILPMERRDLRIAYRGRALPFRYGLLAREKYMIGVEMKRLAAEHGVAADIAVDEESRIYGTDWYRFLGSARATLATESGSNVFDFDGSLKAVGEEAERSGMSFEDFHARHLTELDGVVRMNQASPKIFEAIRLRTALICFEGEYSGVIKPDIHYIPLKQDFSNVADVFAKLEDLEGLRLMTERAYADVIGSGRYSYTAFMHEFDSIIDERVLRQPRVEFVSSPILVKARGESAFSPVVRPKPIEHILNTGVLRAELQRRDLDEVMTAVREAEIMPRRVRASLPPADAQTLRVYGPDAVVCYDFWANAGAAIVAVEGGTRVTTPAQAWHYAAGVPLDFSGIDFAEEFAWVRVVLIGVLGEFRTGLYDADADKLNGEQTVRDRAAETVLHILVTSPSSSLLLFRTGQFETPAHAVVVEARVISAPAFAPAVLETAGHLMTLPPGRYPWWGKA